MAIVKLTTLSNDIARTSRLSRGMGIVGVSMEVISKGPTSLRRLLGQSIPTIPPKQRFQFSLDIP